LLRVTLLSVLFDNDMSISIIDTSPISDRTRTRHLGDDDVRRRASSNDIEFSGLGEGPAYIGCVRISANWRIWRNQMTKIKTISAAVILSVVVAAPAFAATHHVKNFRGTYNQMTDESFAVPSSRAERNIQNFGFSGKDPSRVGGWDPSLNPPS
jgi:hypothetical protein